RRVMDERLAPDFLRQMTRRYGLATLIQIAAIPVALAAPRAGAALALLCVTFFLLPQPKPRYRPGEEPRAKEKLSE
ncbi:MAG: potassium channel family protein, partial [Sphingomonadales bacterium]|nr:potassium channel family protein [Sphingomonadales bacterium]